MIGICIFLWLLGVIIVFVTGMLAETSNHQGGYPYLAGLVGVMVIGLGVYLFVQHDRKELMTHMGLAEYYIDEDNDEDWRVYPDYSDRWRTYKPLPEKQ